MPWKYHHIDEKYYTSNTMKDSTAAIRITDLPEAFRSALLQHYDENISKDPMYIKNYYNTHVREHHLSDSFPLIHEFTFKLKKSSGFLSSLQQKYSTNINFSTFGELYPIAVRYTNGHSVWIIERPPFQATITYKSAGSSTSTASSKTFDIWMPWTVMLVSMNPKSSFYEAYLYFNDGPINSLDDIAVPCFFPNMYGDGKMCLNQTSVLLQQHLAEIDSFDINTIYNFLINDYMSGGWNLDLGIQNFDSIANTNSSTKKVWNTIVNGIDGDKKFPPAYSPKSRYRTVSQKKYILNQLNYFSLCPPEEILQIISSVKSTYLSPTYNGYRKFRTFTELIKDAESRSDSNPDIFSEKFYENPFMEHGYHLLVDSSVDFSLFSAEDFETFFKNINKLIKESLLSNFYKFDDEETNSNFADQSFARENKMIYVKAIDNIAFITADQEQDIDFYLNIISTEKVS